MIPGRILHRLAAVLFAPVFCERVLEPLLADFQHEWLHAEGYLRRTLTLLSGYGAFWCAFALHAARAWRHEIAGMTWRDAFPFPGVIAIVIVLIAVSERWVRTGAASGARFDLIDTRLMWATVPIALMQRCWPTLRGVRGFAVHLTIVSASAMVLMNAEIFQRSLRGWVPLVIYLAIVTLVQPKKSRVSVVKPSHRD